jgi:hypothetical protein
MGFIVELRWKKDFQAFLREGRGFLRIEYKQETVPPVSSDRWVVELNPRRSFDLVKCSLLSLFSPFTTQSLIIATRNSMGPGFVMRLDRHLTTALRGRSSKGIGSQPSEISEVIKPAGKNHNTRYEMGKVHLKVRLVLRIR